MSMNMFDWARCEIERAIEKIRKKDRTEDDFPDKYYEDCLHSALKAYESLCDDGHSGLSFCVTKSILIKLLNEIPLSPITDDDFKNLEDDDCHNLNHMYNRDPNVVSQIQCPRRSSLFRTEYADGTVKYDDIDRSYCVDVNNESRTFHCFMNDIINDMFPITMPYIPIADKYKVYVEDFLMDPKNGDYDHQRVVKVETPDGETINIDGYCFREVDGEVVKCTSEEYNEDKKHKVKYRH